MVVAVMETAETAVQLRPIKRKRCTEVQSEMCDQKTEK